MHILPVLWIYISEKIISWVLSETLEASHVVKCSVFTTVCFVCSLSS